MGLSEEFGVVPLGSNKIETMLNIIKIKHLTLEVLFVTFHKIFQNGITKEKFITKGLGSLTNFILKG